MGIPRSTLTWSGGNCLGLILLNTRHTLNDTICELFKSLETNNKGLLLLVAS